MDGKYHGSGIFKFINGNKYNGKWIQNKMNGLGEMNYSNGDNYNGEWKDDKNMDMEP